MSFGLLVYSGLEGSYNEGDYIQSLAAQQFLPATDVLIGREELSDYSGPKAKVILNGWFMHRPEKWPPSADVDPLFVSFHINRPYAARMLTPQSVDYLRRFAPIGCRDYATEAMLRERGIDAYYSGCLTTTLGRTFERQPTADGEILLVDVFHAVPSVREFLGQPLRYQASNALNGNLGRAAVRSWRLRNIIDGLAARGMTNVHSLSNRKPETADHEQRLELARETVRRYAKAKLVITSRIHCALPCLAIGTPVIFVKYGQTSKSNIMRFKGVLDLMNVVDLDGDMKRHGFESTFLEMDAIDFANPPPNPTRHLALAEKLAARCASFARA